MPASIVCLLVPNGSGKSTIFNLLMGIIKLDSGKIIYNNKEIQNEPVTLRSKLGISVMMQERSLFDLSCEDNLYSIAEISVKGQQKQKEIVERLIREFGIDSLRKQKARN